MSGSHLRIPRMKLLFPKQNYNVLSRCSYTHIYVCERFIYFQDRSAYSAAGKYVERNWEYINRSKTHECGNCDWGRAIPRKGIHKWDFRCCAGILIQFTELFRFSLQLVLIWIQDPIRVLFLFHFRLPIIIFVLKKLDYKTDKRTNGHTCYTVNHLRTRATNHNKARSNRNRPSLWPCDQWGAVLQFVRVPRRAGVGGSLALQGNRGAGIPHKSWGDIRRLYATLIISFSLFLCMTYKNFYHMGDVG